MKMTDLVQFLLSICRQIMSAGSAQFLFTICCQILALFVLSLGNCSESLRTNPAYLKDRIHTTCDIITINIGCHMTDVIRNVNPSFQAFNCWVHLERPRALERRNEQYLCQQTLPGFCQQSAGKTCQ